jgi:hypothetical protein
LKSSDDLRPFPNRQLEVLADHPTKCENSRDLFMDKTTKEKIQEDLFSEKSAKD